MIPNKDLWRELRAAVHEQNLSASGTCIGALQPWKKTRTVEVTMFLAARVNDGFTRPFSPSSMTDLASVEFRICGSCYVGKASHKRFASWATDSRFLKLMMKTLVVWIHLAEILRRPEEIDDSPGKEMVASLLERG